MTQPDTQASSLDFNPPPAPSDLERVAAGEVEARPKSLKMPPPQTPMKVARELLDHLFTRAGIPTLVFWRGQWWKYTDTHWKITEELALRGKLYTLLENAHYLDGDGDKQEQRAWNPTPARITNVLDPLKSLCNEHLSDTREAPVWLEQVHDHPAREYVPMGNGMLHLPTRELVEHSPALFTTYCLPFDYQPNATCHAWSRFLTEVFAHDSHGELLLQECAGYVVSGRTDMHKGFLLVGPARSGKGTVSRTLKELVGVENTHSPALRDFGSDFGLESMIGKPLAVVEDARGDDDRRNNTAVERLLNITGEDQVAINRKQQTYWVGTLPTRLLLVSNETPRFMDASGAVVNRFMAMKLEQSFLGREDHTLGRRIREEMAGVFNWALKGLERLEKQQQFTVPATMGEMLQQMHDAAAPAMTFLEEHYTISGEPEDRVELAEVFRKYKHWCEGQGHKSTSQTEFVRRLEAGGRGVKVKNMDMPGSDWLVSGSGKRSRKRFVLGIK